MEKNSLNSHTPASLACARGSQSLKKAAANIADHAEVSEKAIERHLVEQAKQNGLLCLKYSNPNMVGYPDRLLVLPGGGVVWVELKSKGRKPTKIQQIRMGELTGMGHLVEVIDNKVDIDKLIKTINK
ncbi:MAG: VRR-NUC domain-containing protein [Elusimicrobiaceae bacterium]|nr:VRR-NUC domain-containing protein [Elusimicrobiaceae bacterium]